MRVEYWEQGKLTRTEEVAEPPEVVAERSVTDEAERALVSLRTIANGTSALTLLQLTPIVRGMARVLIVLIRIQLKRFDDVG